MSTTPKLFSPLKLGGKNPVELKHRVTYAPCTRLRANDAGEQPAMAATYYGQRSTDGGLLVTEATNISATGKGYFQSPGIFTDGQVEAWKPVTKAIHDKGGKVFVQLWHTGRVNHTSNQPNNQAPVSSSDIQADTSSWAVTPEGRKEYSIPRPLETEEIPKVVEEYRHATEMAIKAGFDGVEVHSANGYLLEQFLCDNTNKRTDEYGGSIENRARIVFEVLDAVVKEAGSSRVGIRMSPFGHTFGATDSNPAELYSYVIKKLNDYDLAYLHLIEPRGFHSTTELAPKEGVTKYFRPVYDGVLITSSFFGRDEAIETVENGDADLVAWGRAFIANPDLVKRLKLDAPLNEFNAKTAYLAGEEGYINYPFLEETEYGSKYLQN